MKGQLSWGHCLKIYDVAGREVGTVKERVFTFLPKFELYEGPQYIGCLLSLIHISLDYKEGDRVKHAKFGEGTVKEIIDGARDYEITVEFDKGGQKKMLAGFAKLERV